MSDDAKNITSLRTVEQSPSVWTPWAMFGVIVCAIIIGNLAWSWLSLKYIEHEAETAIKEYQAAEAKANEEAQAAYKKQMQELALEQEKQNTIEQQHEEAQKKQEVILAQQRAWENQSNPSTKNTGLTIPIDNEETRAETCKSWKNAQLIDPTPQKEKYIKNHC